MMELTKERLQQIVHAAGLEPWDYEEVFDGITTGEIVMMARQLLAGLEQEPDGWQFLGVNGLWVSVTENGMMEALKEGCEVRPLYAAPQLPQPAVVPECLENLRSLVADKRALPRRKEWISGQQYSYVLLENVEGLVEEACRAAMLQGGKL